MSRCRYLETQYAVTRGTTCPITMKLNTDEDLTEWTVKFTMRASVADNGILGTMVPNGVYFPTDVEKVFGKDGTPENEEDRKMLASVWLLSNISATDQDKE